MFFWNTDLAPFLIFGLLLCVFAFTKLIKGLGFRRKPNKIFEKLTYFQVFNLLAFGICGIASIIVFFNLSINHPPMGRMNKPENQIFLLEQGKVTEGKVIKVWYDEWAPLKWRVFYSFRKPDSAKSKAEVYYGSAWGPKQYYSHLSVGDIVSLIYNPSNPKLNCEMYMFLNYPSYRNTFEQAGKVSLLDRFKDKYIFETYSYISWDESARQK